MKKVSLLILFCIPITGMKPIENLPIGKEIGTPNLSRSSSFYSTDTQKAQISKSLEIMQDEVKKNNAKQGKKDACMQRCFIASIFTCTWSCYPCFLECCFGIKPEDLP